MLNRRVQAVLQVLHLSLNRLRVCDRVEFCCLACVVSHRMCFVMLFLCYASALLRIAGLPNTGIIEESPGVINVYRSYSSCGRNQARCMSIDVEVGVLHRQQWCRLGEAASASQYSEAFAFGGVDAERCPYKAVGRRFVGMAK